MSRTAQDRAWMTPPRTVTAADLGEMIKDLQLQVAELAKTVTADRAIIQVLLAQHGDPTHITVRRAAELLGVSAKTIRRRIDAGIYTLEKRPGEKEGGIPIEQVHGGWTPIGALRSAMQRASSEGKGNGKTR